MAFDLRPPILSRRGLLETAGASMATACAGGRTAGPSFTAEAGQLPTASPERVNFSSVRMDELKANIRDVVGRGRPSGVVTLVVRRGHAVLLDVSGVADPATGVPLSADSIFRIGSMTKPIVGVAMMQLWQGGAWTLDDPVARHIPEFASLQVQTADGDLVAQATPMTMQQLMNHTAGFGPPSAYRNAGLSADDLRAMVVTLSRLPLHTQPGSAWIYGPGVDVQGYLVEKLSGMPLDLYLDRHVFRPLGMVDTGFWLDEPRAARLAALYVGDRRASFAAARPRFLSASGGLYSTVSDYGRFAQALANGGVLDRQRVLNERTVALMCSNSLPPGTRVAPGGVELPGTGFGFGVAVLTDPATAGTPQGPGTIHWAGSFGTWFCVDPIHELVIVSMSQDRAGPNPELMAVQLGGVYAALSS